MAGGQQDCVWSYFDPTEDAEKAVCRAPCTKCAKEMQRLAPE